MNTLSQRIKAAGAVFVPKGDNLKIRSPRPLPPDLLTDLQAVRGDLLDFYRERLSIRIYDAGMPDSEAQAAAAHEVNTQ